MYGNVWYIDIAGMLQIVDTCLSMYTTCVYIYILAVHMYIIICIFIVCSFLWKSVLFDCCTFQAAVKVSAIVRQIVGCVFCTAFLGDDLVNFGITGFLVPTILPSKYRRYLYIYSWYMLVYIIRLLSKSGTHMFHCRFVVPHLWKTDLCFWCFAGQ